MATHARLILICGLPGAGKTTLAKQLEQERLAVRLSADDWMEVLSIDLYDEERRAAIEALQWRLAETLLGRAVTVIIEWGSWRRVDRDRLRLGARAVGAAVELHYLTASPEILFERLAGRGREQPAITREMLLAWHDQFEPPGPDEMALFDPPCPAPMRGSVPHDAATK